MKLCSLDRHAEDLAFCMIPRQTGEMDEDSIPVPPEGSPFFPDINEFALTYNAYSRVSGVRTAAQIGNGARARYRNDGSFPDDLDELRAALFFEQRRYHHFGEGPEGAALDYIQALVGAIRCISGGAVPGPADPLP